MTELKLLPFQVTCVEKLAAVPSGLCGDDMGLGKTVEAIMIDKRKRELHEEEFRKKGKALTLVVAPTSILESWARHFRRWNPKLQPFVIPRKLGPALARAAFVRAVMSGKYDVYITHWESLRLMPELRKVLWFHIIADEVHRAKNRKAAQTTSLKLLRTPNKLGCSGTAADNRIDDLWSPLNWLYPKQWSSYWTFRDKHVDIKHHDTRGLCGCDHWHKKPYDEILGPAAVEELHHKMAPYYVRRLKEDVLEDLPDKYYSSIFVDLTPQQRKTYDDMRQHMLAWIGAHEDQPLAAPIVAAQLVRLQQFAVAYARLEKVLKRYRNCEREPCKTAQRCIAHEVTVVRLQEPSSKLDAVMQLIEDNPDKQLAVYSQSKQAVQLLDKRLQAKSIPNLLFTGDTPQEARDGLVEDFQDGKYRTITATISAGGEGITLTAASTVAFLDRAWSPSRNKQAEDRLHRIGQKNAVHVIDIIARNTVDLGRLQRIRTKWEWLKELLGDRKEDEDERWLSSV